MPKKLRILLVYGGPSSEYAISLESGKMVFSALDRKKYNCETVTIRKDNKWRFDDSQIYAPGAALAKIERRKFDIAFLALHGAFGEDGQIQTLLESIGLPYTGSKPEASALAMNKAVSCLIFKHNGLEVPSFLHITSVKKPELNKKIFPAVIKPCHGGSSVRVSIVKNFNEAWDATKKILDAGDSAIVQQMISGREFTCGILEDVHGNPRALPPTEIIPIKGKFFDYKAKYAIRGSREITPPKISDALLKKIQNAALRAHTALGCSGMSRSDFIYDDKKLYILETNTIPGMTQTSLLPQEARVAGISFSDMLDRIIQSALR